MKKNILYFLIFQCCLFTSFAQDRTKEITDNLMGTWIWDSTRVCQRTNPPAMTPASTGYIRKLIFEDNKIQEYRNDSIIGSSVFSITRNAYGGEVYYIFDSDLIRGTIGVDGNKLSISTCASDGFHNEFTKMKE